jgi:hypothetical protein
MVLLFNVYLAPDAPWFTYDRGGRPSPNKFEILEHTLFSYRNLGFRKAYLNIEVDPSYLLEVGLPESKWWHRWLDALGMKLNTEAVIRYRRCCRQNQWQEMVKEIESDLEYDQEPIWYCGNHDHPYINTGDSIYGQWSTEIKKLFWDYQDEPISVIYSHWAEFLDQARLHEPSVRRHGGLSDKLKFLGYRVADVHSIRVIQPRLLRSWWFDHDYGDLHLPRSDWWTGGGPWDGGHIPVKSPEYLSFVPTQELCRHFDGYSHIGVGPDSPCPPLTIPPTPENFSWEDRANVVARMNGREIPKGWYPDV